MPATDVEIVLGSDKRAVLNCEIPGMEYGFTYAASPCEVVAIIFPDGIGAFVPGVTANIRRRVIISVSYVFLDDISSYLQSFYLDNKVPTAVERFAT